MVYRSAESLDELFWDRLMMGLPSEQCWTWPGHLDEDGYGSLKHEKRPYRAHRVSWAIHSGRMPCADEVVRHTCDNPPCVNPAHLLVGTVTDNNRDTVQRERRKDQRGEGHPNAKLTEIQVMEIRELAGTISERKLALKYGVSAPTISDVVTQRTWAHV